MTYKTMRNGILVGVLCCSIGCSGSIQNEPAAAVSHDNNNWQHYGGTLDGTRFAPSEAINSESVKTLTPAWEFQTGDATTGDDSYSGRTSSFKATPIFFRDKLIVSTGFNRVIALDPSSGSEIWRYDPQVDFTVKYSEMFTSRGVAAWSDPKPTVDSVCQHRVYLGTLDARLIAIDAETGAACHTFGKNGEVNLAKGIKRFRKGEYSVTSPPTVVNGVVIVGSSIGDNGGVALDEGAVRAYDARSGELRWRFDPIPRNAKASGWSDWQPASAKRTGAANVWSTMAADPERDLVFLPTTSPSPDFYGGERLGDNRNANSVVAIKASTGKLVWTYQLVHHDLWDYDLAAQPLLIDVSINGTVRPALVQATKMGFIFVLDRETGEPLHAVIEQPVPESDVEGEVASSTQPFPSLQLHSSHEKTVTIWDKDPNHKTKCEVMLENVIYEGIYTPPSLSGTLVYPGNPGGVNWGSMAADPSTSVALVAINRLPTVVKLIPRSEFNKQRENGTHNGVRAQFTEQSGTPYGMMRYDLYNRDNGLPCLAGPWSTLVAIDVAAGNVLWEQPVGVAPNIDPQSPAARWGYVVRGGPMITAGGIAFLATPYDFTLRAYDVNTGNVLWHSELPAQPEATPMSYTFNDSNYVVITAGGKRRDNDHQGDFVIAFKLP